MIFNLIYSTLVTQVLVNNATTENNTYETSQKFYDQMVFMQEFGKNGANGPMEIPLSHELQPGAVISIVAKSQDRGTIDLEDASKDIFLHVDARISTHNIKDQVILNSYLNSEWHQENIVKLPIPVSSDVKATITLIYEARGYRVFINGKEIGFYEHRTDKTPSLIKISYDYVYKVMYSYLITYNY